MEQKKVSIILPTYNGVKYIKESIKSCLNQSYKNLEIIVVDDGSSESIKNILSSFKDDRIKYIRHHKNMGLPESLNTGFAASSGDYLTWHSDDNIYRKDAIEKLVQFLEKNNNMSFVYADCWLIDEYGSTIGKSRMKSPNYLDITNCIGACFMYGREVYKKCGDYNPDYRLAEDYEYWLRVRQNFKMKHLKEFLYYYRSHKNSLTSITKKWEIANQVKRAAQNYVNPSAQYYHKAICFFYQKMNKEAQREIKKCIINNPFNFYAWKLYIFLIFKNYFPNISEKILKVFHPSLYERLR